MTRRESPTAPPLHPIIKISYLLPSTIEDFQSTGRWWCPWRYRLRSRVPFWEEVMCRVARKAVANGSSGRWSSMMVSYVQKTIHNRHGESHNSRTATYFLSSLPLPEDVKERRSAASLVFENAGSTWVVSVKSPLNAGNNNSVFRGISPQPPICWKQVKGGFGDLTWWTTVNEPNQATCCLPLLLTKRTNKGVLSSAANLGVEAAA